MRGSGVVSRCHPPLYCDGTVPLYIYDFTQMIPSLYHCCFFATHRGYGHCCFEMCLVIACLLQFVFTCETCSSFNFFAKNLAFLIDFR